jgi:hypothetical protein
MPKIGEIRQIDNARGLWRAEYEYLLVLQLPDTSKPTPLLFTIPEFFRCWDRGRLESNRADVIVGRPCGSAATITNLERLGSEAEFYVFFWGFTGSGNPAPYFLANFEVDTAKARTSKNPDAIDSLEIKDSTLLYEMVNQLSFSVE